jgi:CO/xanthine dehydrogenase FAD-binding subunit
VKPAPFVYLAPHGLDEAVALLAEHGSDAKLLAGGQSLVPAMNFRLAQPAVLVDLNGVAELDGIAPTDEGGVSMGAMTRQRAVEHSALVAARAPLLAEAMPWVAHMQIRTRGTIGGSLAHADPAAELPAVACALGATLRLRGHGGERHLLADQFFTGLFATALQPGELVVGVTWPAPSPRQGTAFLEVSRRHGDFALTGVAVCVALDVSGACSAARVALLSVGDGPVVSARVAAVLVGEQPTDAVLTAAAEALDQDLDPPSDIHASAAYRRQLARVLTRRALATAFARARVAAPAG